MITKINSESELCDLFNDCPYGTFKHYLQWIQFPIIIFLKKQNIKTKLGNEDFTYYYYDSQNHGYVHTLNEFKNKLPMLIFDDVNNVYKITNSIANCDLTIINSSVFYGVNMDEIILDNAKILIFMDAIHDNNSNVIMLNYDVLNYILSFFGPFCLLKK